MSRRWVRYAHNEPTLIETMLTMSRRPEWNYTVQYLWFANTKWESNKDATTLSEPTVYAYDDPTHGETLFKLNQRWVRLCLQWTSPELLLSYDEPTLSETLLMMNQHGDGLAAVNRCRGRLCLWWANAEWDERVCLCWGDKKNATVQQTLQFMLIPRKNCKFQ